MRRFLADHPLDFPLLVDPDRAVIKAYGVYQFLWFDAFNIARPAVFLLDEGGVVRRVAVGDSQWDRPAQDEILAAVREAG